KENTKINTSEIKEVQTYVCNGMLYLKNDEGYNWYLPNDELLNDVFTLKEQTFDLHKLTTAQLKEYNGLLEKELKVAENSLNEFMERRNKLIKLTSNDETTVYVNINHIAAFYQNKSWEYTIVILSDGTQLDIKDSVESIAKYF